MIFLFQKPLYRAMIDREPDSYNAKDDIECALALNHDGVWLPLGGFNGFQPEYLTQYCRFFQEMSNDIVSFEVCIGEILPDHY